MSEYDDALAELAEVTERLDAVTEEELRARRRVMVAGGLTKAQDMIGKCFRSDRGSETKYERIIGFLGEGDRIEYKVCVITRKGHDRWDVATWEFGGPNPAVGTEPITEVEFGDALTGCMQAIADAIGEPFAATPGADSAHPHPGPSPVEGEGGSVAR